MKVKLTKPFEWEHSDGRTETIGPGNVVAGPLAKAALAAKAGTEIEDNAPDFNPLPGTPKKEMEKRTVEQVESDTLKSEMKTGTPSTLPQK